MTDCFWSEPLGSSCFRLSRNFLYTSLTSKKGQGNTHPMLDSFSNVYVIAGQVKACRSIVITWSPETVVHYCNLVFVLPVSAVFTAARQINSSRLSPRRALWFHPKLTNLLLNGFSRVQMRDGFLVRVIRLELFSIVKKFSLHVVNK